MKEYLNALATLVALGVIAPLLYFRWYIIYGAGILFITFNMVL